MNPPDREETHRLALSLRSSLEEDRFWGLTPFASKEPDPSPLPRAKAASPPPQPAPSEPAAVTPAEKTRSLFEAPNPPPAAKLSREERARRLEEIASEVRACKKCHLWESRTNAVPGEGNPKTRILFVGEGPGATEDETGRPFVGRAGQLLTDIIEKGMGIPRSEVYITNIVKCRPPENREPAPDEVRACMPYLRRQIEILSPELIMPLGRPAAAALLETQEAMSRLRGRVHRKEGRRFLPTFHPAYLLRNPPEKKKTWEDVQLAMRELGLPILRRGPPRSP